jgi:hypothetical protein
MAGCPSGWSYVEKCNQNRTCEDGCDIWGIGYAHNYDRCKNSSGTTNCFYVSSVYEGCDCKHP